MVGGQKRENTRGGKASLADSMANARTNMLNYGKNNYPDRGKKTRMVPALSQRKELLGEGDGRGGRRLAYRRGVWGEIQYQLLWDGPVNSCLSHARQKNCSMRQDQVLELFGT